MAAQTIVATEPKQGIATGIVDRLYAFGGDDKAAAFIAAGDGDRRLHLTLPVATLAGQVVLDVGVGPALHLQVIVGAERLKQGGGRRRQRQSSARQPGEKQ